MATQSCDVCGDRVRIAGGIGDFWTFTGAADDGGSRTTGGVDLELADGSEWFVCLDCIGRLPDDRDVLAEDVEALRE